MKWNKVSNKNKSDNNNFIESLILLKNKNYNLKKI